MSQKRPHVPQHIPGIQLNRMTGDRQFTDTDPQMLHAMWLMGFGADPDKTLEEVEHSVTVYDKFAPGVSRR